MISDVSTIRTIEKPYEIPALWVTFDQYDATAGVRLNAYDIAALVQALGNTDKPKPGEMYVKVH